MLDKKAQHTTYQDAGVDIAAANTLMEAIKPVCERASHPNIIKNRGGFAGLFELPSNDYRNPVMLGATDGVGTKLHLTKVLGRYDTIGADLVAMCVNDILAHGGKPVAFLDYYSCDKLDAKQACAVIAGIARACREAGAGLIGGETAEMPGCYQPGNYDLAGFAIGLAEKDALLPANVSAGDIVIGVASSGVHSNGFSLINHIINTNRVNLNTPFDGKTLGETLLTQTKIYVRQILPLIEQRRVRALAHITGGGITENLPRVLPAGHCAQIDTQAWQRPDIFDWIQQQANVEDMEMLKVFNCGIGMCIVAAAEQSDMIIRHLAKQKLDARKIGEIRRHDKDEPCVVYR